MANSNYAYRKGFWQVDGDWGLFYTSFPVVFFYLDRIRLRIVVDSVRFLVP